MVRFGSASVLRSGPVRFLARTRDRSRTRVLDLSRGASGYDGAWGLAADGAGAAYVAGYTPSPDFPTENPFQGVHASGHDVFVTKMAPGGDRLVYSTFIGGDADDVALDLSIDDLGSAYVVGYTESDDFPTQSPLQLDQPGRDAFVAKLTPGGDQLAYSTYIGGSDFDLGRSNRSTASQTRSSRS